MTKLKAKRKGKARKRDKKKLSGIRLPQVSGQQARRAFERDGWQLARMGDRGHIIMVNPGHQAHLSIPNHKSLRPGLLRGLIRDAGLTVARFLKLLLDT